MMHFKRQPIKLFLKKSWKERWLAGCFIWKWFPDMKRENDEGRKHKFRDKYTPQGKVGEEVLKEYFKNK